LSALTALLAFTAAANAQAGELIANGGFENPYLGTLNPYLGNFTYPGLLSYPGNPPEALIYPDATLDSWTYNGSALVNGQTGSDWYGPIPPTGFGGYQFAALQSMGSLSQDFTSPGGDLTLSWLTGGRPNLFGAEGGDQTYVVEVDGSTVGTFSTVSGEAFTPETLALTGVSAGSHTLAFQGLVASDETAFLDNVLIVTGTVVTVPEPATWILAMVGFGARGAAPRASRLKRTFKK
jgi:hypothetical protein